jgi:spore photoproduct lyase
MYFDRFIFEQAALKTEYGKQLFSSLIKKGLSPEIKQGRSAVYTIEENKRHAFGEGKRTLIIGSRSPSKFENCRPSADYQLPVFTGCPGLCEYCYLMTRMGEQPYVKLNANIVNVLTNITKYIEENMPKTTSFELSASSDPLPFEEPTGIVSFIINHFASLPNGRLRICTKFEPNADILKANHNGHTDFRFSINTPGVIDSYEHVTPSLDRRISAAKNIINAGYKTGIMIAPVFLDDDWKNDYAKLIENLKSNLGSGVSTFEVVTHRYTTKAKETINNIFPQTKLDMDDEKRKFKMGQFGYGKYVYDSEKIKQVKEFFSSEISKQFPDSELLYVV